MAVAVLIERSVPPPDGISGEMLLIINGIFIFGAILASRFIGMRLLASAKRLGDVQERMLAGLRAFIVRLAILEAAGLLSVVSYILTGENSFFGVFAIVCVAFMLGKPSEDEWEAVEKGDHSGSSF